jgi:protoporphyrinogen oxidase
MPRFVILGAGPTGIGAALRLLERGEPDFVVLEASATPGGLAGSVVDDQGFTWDLGGHVQFSHYRVFDEHMDLALGKEGWLHHVRESWVRMRGGFIPYPFQNNLHRLPPEERWDCVRGLLHASRAAPPAQPSNFEEWILATFGAGIARSFMTPYNLKVWAHPLQALDWRWIGDRVAVPPLDRVLEGICLGRDQVSWGPNSTFRFPKRGGTGAVWRALSGRLPGTSLRLGDRVTSIDPVAREVSTAAGLRFRYESLLTSAPVDALTRLLGRPDLVERTSRLLFSSTHVVGIGLEGQPGDELRTKCWMYFPEDDCPFYRVTVFSNYSPENAPRPGETWSLMAEVSESPFKRVARDHVREDVLSGLRATGLLGAKDRVLSLWSTFLDHGYPVPSLERDAILGRVLPELEALGIYSRGRFGAWTYEVSNQDHSFMQGRECVDRILDGDSPEAQPTLRRPAEVNAGYR